MKDCLWPKLQDDHQHTHLHNHSCDTSLTLTCVCFPLFVCLFLIFFVALRHSTLGFSGLHWPTEAYLYFQWTLNYNTVIKKKTKLVCEALVVSFGVEHHISQPLSAGVEHFSIFIFKRIRPVATCKRCASSRTLGALP